MNLFSDIKHCEYQKGFPSLEIFFTQFLVTLFTLKTQKFQLVILRLESSKSRWLSKKHRISKRVESEDENGGKWNSETKWGMDHLTPNFRPAKQRAGKSEIGCPVSPRELELVEGRKSRRGRGLAMQIVRRRVCEITDILGQYLPPSRNCKFVHEPIEYEPLNLNVFTRNYRFLRSKSIYLTIDIIPVGYAL